MSYMLEKINSFLNDMLESEEKFKVIHGKISNVKENIESEIKILKDDLDKSINEISLESVDNKEIRNVLESSIKNTNLIIKQCLDEIEGAQKGMTFIKKFEEHFIVSVFGKVKSGKSSLGNFIMGNDIKKLGLKSNYDKFENIKVTVYDRGNQKQQTNLNILEEELSEFGVKSTEATSTIQWFYLGGLAWFDTPGIGSITKDNENLAKEYVQNSDLVIFSCNSDAAGTRQEFMEMKELYGMNKPILLLITMSDTNEEDEDENGNIIKILVPKSDKDRKDVEDYMLETLNEEGLEEILKYSNILTISTKLACEALRKNDDNLFKASNMDKFLDVISEITKNEAAKLKLNTPKDRVNKLLDDLLGNEKRGLNFLDKYIENSYRNLKSQKEELSKIKEIILDRTKDECIVLIENEMRKFKMKVEKEKITISNEEIQKNVQTLIFNQFSKICTEELSEYITDIDKKNKLDINKINLEVSSMEMKRDSISYEVTHIDRVERDTNGFFEFIGSKVFGKKYYKTKRWNETKYNYFDIGVNDSSIINQIMSQLNDIFNTIIDDVLETMIKGYFQPIEKLNDNIKKRIDISIEKLKNLKIE